MWLAIRIPKMAGLFRRAMETLSLLWLLICRHTLVLISAIIPWAVFTRQSRFRPFNAFKATAFTLHSWRQPPLLLRDVRWGRLLQDPLGLTTLCVCSCV